MSRPPKAEWPSRVFRESKGYARLATGLGGQIRKLRTARGWTLERAGEHTGLDPTQIAKIEAGTINVTLVTLARISEGFGVEVRELFTARRPHRGT